MAFKIGVLGGIGPEATAEFYTLLIRKLQDTGLIRKNRDFPQILINSIPAPELIYTTITEKNLQPYRQGLKELDVLHCDFIVMVCNTIHLYLEELQQHIKTPILDLREGMKRFLARKGIASVLILGTPTTITQGLYMFPNLLTFTPTQRELQSLTRAIFNFNRGREKRKQTQLVQAICKKYSDADAIILGCTEFGIMLKDHPGTINTIDVLVEMVVKEFLSRRHSERA